jgi:nucleotide-binding universal stress UspA family protein
MFMYDRILVPVDGSPTSEAGLEETIRLASLTRSRMLLRHAVDAAVSLSAQAAAFTTSVYDALHQGGKEILARAKLTAKEAGIAAETTLIDTRAERVSDRVVDHARKWQADLIVIGTHGRRGVGRLLLSSDAEQIVRTSPVRVLLVRAGRPQ